MTEDHCAEFRREVQSALEELERVRAGHKTLPVSTGPNQRLTPPMGSDLGSRFYESVGRHEAASRRYRAAIRSLSECLRQQLERPGVIDSAHD
jgi:hypothetical protein